MVYNNDSNDICNIDHNCHSLICQDMMMMTMTMTMMMMMMMMILRTTLIALLDDSK